MIQAGQKDLPKGRVSEPGRTGLVSPLDLECRVCELETDNARLRLLVGELLVANQRLREDYKRLRGDQRARLETKPAFMAR